MQTKNLKLAYSTAVIMILTFTATFKINPILAETGNGGDIFKVIMTIFGVDGSKGDIIAIVTTNNGEASRVKFLDSEAPYVVPLNASAVDSGRLLEYVATFPNVTVNAGEEYKACALTTKELNMICSTGQNSPASRPEFVDLSLNTTTTTDTQEETMEEGDATENNDEN
jgi:hypothetical protein